MGRIIYIIECALQQLVTFDCRYPSPPPSVGGRVSQRGIQVPEESRGRRGFVRALNGPHRTVGVRTVCTVNVR